jgi:hypothetical protein
MFPNQFTDEKRGMVFSIDLMLALIILTVSLGVTADALDIVGGKMQDYSYTNSLERITLGAADMLIKEPGSPENWEQLNNLDGVTPGLASTDPGNMKVQSKSLDIVKINRFKENYRELMIGKVLPEYCHSNLVIYPIDRCVEPISMGEGAVNSSYNDVVMVNRTVLCNFINSSLMVFIDTLKYNSSNLEQDSLGEECPHQDIMATPNHSKVDYKNYKPGWICYHFRVARDMLNSTDFYLMTDPVNIEDPSAVWLIDRPENRTETVNSFSNRPILVNDQINAAIGNESTVVLWLHVFSCGNPEKAFNTYLAGFPKGTPMEMVKAQSLNPQPCYFVFKVWT